MLLYLNWSRMLDLWFSVIGTSDKLFVIIALVSSSFYDISTSSAHVFFCTFTTSLSSVCNLLIYVLYIQDILFFFNYLNYVSNIVTSILVSWANFALIICPPRSSLLHARASSKQLASSNLRTEISRKAQPSRMQLGRPPFAAVQEDNCASDR